MNVRHTPALICLTASTDKGAGPQEQSHEVRVENRVTRLVEPGDDQALSYGGLIPGPSSVPGLP